ncbi:MAG: DNA mismatch repair protein MutS [Anaeroplasmataceae bacterium]
MTIDDVDVNKLSPMMQQYVTIKKENMDSIVFYRVGDFYEMFFEDAYLASRILELQLTGKDASLDERVPMCGIPFHAYQVYATKLLDNGFKVAIVEQVEDPKLAKGLVKRDVIKVLTPGTTVDTDLNSKENNYIVSIGAIKREYVLAYADSSTGEVYVTKVQSLDSLANEIISLHAKEIIVNTSFMPKILDNLHKNYQIVISHNDNTLIPDYLKYVTNGISEEFIPTIGILLNYLTYTIKTELTHMREALYYESKDYLRLDPFTKRNLELTETLRQGQKNGSLLWLLDKCQTAMGSRMLHKWIDKPLVDTKEIEKRLDFVEALNNNYIIKEEIKESLKTIYDLERIVGRISVGNANGKDLVQLRKSLANIPMIKGLVTKLDLDAAINLANNIDTHYELCDLLNSALVENPPMSIKEGGMINDGYNSDLDEIKNISKNSKDWILNYERELQEQFKIGKGLKVGYNRVFGYYIEVSKSNINLIPEDAGYERKQTLANAERFISPELKHYEQIVLGSDEKIVKLEYDLFIELRDECKKQISSLQNLANIISILDVYISFSEVSTKNNYVRPNINNSRLINIVDGRHPVVETVLDDEYVCNDIVINKYNTLLITGPNMSGKSTYMRQLALISIMTQIGCFVPAKSCDICIFDSIFTRIGASDDLMSGQSTFMVEMMEANYAITNATKNSLILFDELGRGTSTFDGMALAQAIIEYVHERIGCVMLFSTHYHELTELENSLKRLKNVHVSAKETDKGVVFLHKVLDGGADKSYGINVASLAGLPKSLIERSKQVLSHLEESELKTKVNLDLFNFLEYDSKPEVLEENKAEKIKKAIDELDLNNLTPMDALKFLYDLKNEE